MGSPRSLAEVEAHLTPEQWRLREAEAATEAAVLEQVLTLVRAGESRSAALRALLPDKPVFSTLRRLRRYELGGRDGLVNRRLPVTPVRKMDDEARGALRALAMSEPAAGSELLSERLSEVLGRSIRPTAVQLALRDLGLARPRGRPAGKSKGRDSVAVSPDSGAAVITPLPLAGCELLKAVDEDIGAIGALTRAIGAHLAQLPKAEGPVLDDGAGRDEQGRFQASYNKPAPRTEPELGARFNTVETRRRKKDLPAMRVANESEETHQRKNAALTFLPVVVRGPRWSALEHWRGDHLGELVGFAYQASTLDKYLRELKFSGAAMAAREAVVSFWARHEGPIEDERTGAVLVYIDAKTKPLWTHHWTRSTKVSETGRVMPAVTTMTLHSGAGTPLVYRSWSGHVSVPVEVTKFLDTYEGHAGEGTARRVVVIDREAHAVWLFKALAESGRSYIIPLRKQVVGPSARFEEVGPWTPYREGSDEVCDGYLWLNDSRKGEKALRVRVVGRKRHRTGNISWYATNTPREEFPPSDIVRLYFERWPAQEHVYRDGSGVVGLDAHHGYGKKKVKDVAILDKLDKLDGRVFRLTAEKETHMAAHAKVREDLAEWEAVVASLEPEMGPRRAHIATAIREGQPGEKLADAFEVYETMERWLTEARDECRRLRSDSTDTASAVAEREKKLRHLPREREKLERRREIFTVDVELDEIMTAFKLTFMNLCSVLMGLLGKRMELETLIEAVLTLPGERVVTPTTETVRIFRPSRDSRTMKSVEKACAALTARGLRRNGRDLRFEIGERPVARMDPMDPRLRPS